MEKYLTGKVRWRPAKTTENQTKTKIFVVKTSPSQKSQDIPQTLYSGQ